MSAVGRNQAKQIAFGGVFAALAMVVMCLGGIVPIATFVLPMVCMLILRLICTVCGNRIGWAWYGCVALLSVLIGPDKEAAAVFACLGYYPILQPKFHKLPWPWLWKMLYFNVVVILLYCALFRIFGMDQLAAEYQDLGTVFNVVLVLLGNVVFVLLDLVLIRFGKRRKRRG